MGATQTVSVLFTDLVGSTRLAAELGASRWEPCLRNHLRELTGNVERDGGNTVKNVGDGVMAVFKSASDALSCAVAMQQRVELRNRTRTPALAMRVGVASGDAEGADGDWFGWPVIEARRLCDAAQAGQILVTETLRRIAVPADARTLEPIGAINLKGFPEPVPTWRVAWRPPDGEADRPPLPSSLQDLPASGFVGRSNERRQLAEQWRRAQDGERGLVLVSGEAGVGKTTLAGWLAIDAHRDGAFALYGRSEEEVGLPYEPWRQALAHLVTCLSDDALRRHVDRHGQVLASLAPHLSERVGAPPPLETSDAETERYLLFAAVVGLLEAAAEERPVLLVLDDVHGAGRPTLALLKHVELAAPQMRLLVLGTHRTTGGLPGRPLDELLETLRRRVEVRRLALGGLTEAEVRTMLGAVAGDAPGRAGDTVARELHEWTEGNPFFVAETVRHLSETGARWTVPGGLRALQPPTSVIEVIRGRVARLGPETAHALQCAAAIGRDFDVQLLASVVEPDHRPASGIDGLLNSLDEAARAYLIAEHEGGHGRYRFVHALVGHALEQELGTARRARLHERIAEALEARIGQGASYGDLAHHWAAASGPSARAKTLEYRMRAGRAALEQLAPDEALEWFEMALGSVSAGEEIRRELLLGLGEAQVHAAKPEFRETLLEAAALSRDVADWDRLIRAALLNNRGMFSSSGQLDEERLAVLEIALEHASRDEPRRARLLGLMAAELLWSGDHARRRALSDEAVSLAREHGDSAALAYVLIMRVTAVWGLHNLDERLAITAEAVSLSEVVGDPLQLFWALVWRAATLVQAGAVSEADRQLEALSAVATRVGDPRLRFVAAAQHVWRAQLAGRLAEAEQLCDAARAIGEQSGEPDVMALYAAQFLQTRWQQGRLGEVAEIAELVASSAPRISLFRAAAALATYEAGGHEDARRLLSATADRRFEDVPDDPVALGALTLWAELAARLGDRASAAVLLPLLEDVAGLLVTEALGTLGVVSRSVGALAATLGRTDEADRLFADAVAAHERLGARSLVARTRIEWGLATASSQNRWRARQLLASGAEEAARLELPALEHVARRALTALDGSGVDPAGQEAIPEA